MTSRAFRVVEMFEEAVAEFAGARYGVAVESCSMALYLSCVYSQVQEVTIPARTYISVPAAIHHAGGTVNFLEQMWTGTYKLAPYGITDGALRMRPRMYEGDLHCLSFHARKLLPIGRGGMILTDSPRAVAWLQQARFDGRHGSVPFMRDDIFTLGWNAYMTPEQAARGLQLLEAMPNGKPDLMPEYPDLRSLPVFTGVPV